MGPAMIHTLYPLTTDSGLRVHVYHYSFVATNEMGLYAQ